MFDIFASFSIPPQYISTDDGTQLEKSLKWGDIFDIIKGEHWHQNGKCTSPHSESFYHHLRTCAQMSYDKAAQLGFTEHTCPKPHFCGLLHDLGKPGTRRVLGKYLAFKGHGIVGGALIENFWTPEIESVFGLTPMDWGDISMAADTHMCGYFPEQTTPTHAFCFQMLSNEVKMLLMCLRWGDICSMVPTADYKKTKTEIIAEAVETEPAFMKMISQDPDISFLPAHKLDHGILIQMCGSSSTGKSFLANKIKTDLMARGIKTIIVNRDSYMVKNSMAMMGKRFDIGDEITPEIYSTCYSFYISRNKSYAGRINEDMTDAITEGLNQGWVVILDTMMTMFPKVLQTILPECVSNAFKISIWTHRNTPITEEESRGRLGMGLKEQLAAYEGSKSIMNPFRESLYWDDLIAMTERRDLTESSPHHAHLAFSFGRTGIKNHILEHLYTNIGQIYGFNQSIWRVPLIGDTMDATLLELVEHLYRHGGIEAIKSFFPTYAYRVSQPFKDTKYENKVIGIKYIDGMNNIWKPKWSREARGRFYYLGDAGVIPLKDSLQRGIEVLTKSHKEHGITATQDIDWKTIERVDAVQGETIKAFSGINDYVGILSGKVDGSLLIVNHYPVGSPQAMIMKEIIEEVGDDFSKALCKFCFENSLPLLTISTQGTILISSEMQDYFITSLQSLITFEFTDVLDTWIRILPEFAKLVMEYISAAGLLDKVLNICFESYCKDRRTFTGVLHTELAIGYNHSGFNLLGLMVDNHYVPHFELPKIVFNQPVFMPFSNTTQVFEIMDDMDKVVLGEMSHKDFMTKYFPDKLDYPIHMEGWVLLTPTGSTFDYSKIKTNLYYKCHKVKDENVDELLRLPASCQEYYPIIKILVEFFTNSAERLLHSVKAIYDKLNSSLTKESVFYVTLNDKAQKRVDEYIANPTDKNREIAFKILINNCQSQMMELILGVNKDIWNNSTPELASFMKELIMKVEPWKGMVGGNYPKLAQMIEAKDPFLSNLYNIFFNENA